LIGAANYTLFRLLEHPPEEERLFTFLLYLLLFFDFAKDFLLPVDLRLYLDDLCLDSTMNGSILKLLNSSLSVVIICSVEAI
jgi:hypothetical protein